MKFHKFNSEELTVRARISIERKLSLSINLVPENEVSIWHKAYKSFIKKMNETAFGGIVFDYDGTLCSSERKFEGPDQIISELLFEILEKDFYIGIATGRGKSVKYDLRKVLPQRFWSKVLIGYYNCSDIAWLDDDSHPNLDFATNKHLEQLYQSIIIEFKTIRADLRPNQLTIKRHENSDVAAIDQVKHYVLTSEFKDVQVLESSHSIDIIPMTKSKTDILPLFKETLIQNSLPQEVICIGDKGNWPGNDYQLLAREFSLSVDETSPDKKSCWNIASMGNSKIDATIEYLKWLQFGQKKIRFKARR